VQRVLRASSTLLAPPVATHLQPGNPAPEFDGLTQDGTRLRLSDFRNQPVVLFFYPEDDTPGCTKEVCNLRDNYQTLLDAGLAVVGVSADDVASHVRFAQQHSLPFPLVADPELRILEQYGVVQEDDWGGRVRLNARRTTFLISPEGRILHVFERPRTEQHAEEILDWMDAHAMR